MTWAASWRKSNVFMSRTLLLKMARKDISTSVRVGKDDCWESARCVYSNDHYRLSKHLIQPQKYPVLSHHKIPTVTCTLWWYKRKVWQIFIAQEAGIISEWDSYWVRAAKHLCLHLRWWPCPAFHPLPDQGRNILCTNCMIFTIRCVLWQKSRRGPSLSWQIRSTFSKSKRARTSWCHGYSIHNHMT